MSDAGVHEFVAPVKRKRHDIVMEVAAGHPGAPRREMENVLHRRLEGTGATPADVAAWAELVCERPASTG